MLKTLLLTAFLLTFAGVAPAQTIEPLLLQKPTLSRTQIVFVYAGDLWIVGRDGGTASRLTTGSGVETDPKFSPDGSMIAFTGEYDGNVDVYVMPAEGGEPRRITYHPGADQAIGWTPDGKRVMFLSTRGTGLPVPKMYTMPVTGEGLPTELPFPMAGGGASFSPDGSKLAYMPLAPAFLQWKKYRGGRTTKIWIGNLSDSAVEEVPRQNSNDIAPMWVGNKIYFISDRSGRNFTLYSYDTASKKVTEAIANTGLDLKSASAGPDGIVYEQFGTINIYDTSSGKSSRVNITLNGDLAQVRPRYERVAQRIDSVALSPTGARAVFGARGEIISVPAEKGNARNLTYAVERWAWYQQEGPPEPFSHPGSSLHLIPLIAWATSLGHQHSPNSGPAKASSYSCCNREQPSHLKRPFREPTPGHSQDACRQLRRHVRLVPHDCPSSTSVTAGDGLRKSLRY